MADKIVYFIVYIAEALIAYIYLYDNFKLKQKQSVSILIALVLYIFGFIMNIVFENNLFVNLVMFFIINLVYSISSFDVSIKNGILHSSVLLALMTVTELIVETGASLLLDIPIDAYNNSLSYLVILGIVEKILYLLVCKIISTLFSYKKNNTPNDIKKNYALFLYPLITTIMLLVFSYTSAVYNFSDKINLVFIITSVISLIFCCYIFIVNQQIQIQEKELIELKTEHQKNEIDKTFYELLEKKNEEQNLLVHDIKHHFLKINTIDNADSIKQYISTIHPEIKEYKYIGKSQNKMLDLILSKYYNLCEINKIRFIADIRSCNLKFIDDNDLTSMLGNLLDNAVEAAKGVENAEVRFSARTDKSFYVITIINSSSHPPKIFEEKLLTTKEDKRFHGYGVKSVERIVERYDAASEWWYNENKKEFHFVILFNRNGKIKR